MATGVQIVIDCADPARLAAFWAEALGYRLQDPPTGFATWPDFLAARGVPESEWNSANAVVDPEGRGPRLFFQRVPEPKTVKNRVHLDLNVGGGPGTPQEVRREHVQAEVQRLQRIGAAQVRAVEERGEFWIVMQDLEGNEFCVQ
jgi:glyoxalase superfamily protein